MIVASLSVIIVSVLFLVESSWADVSHFFAPEFGFFQQHPFHLPLQPPPQSSIPNLYAAPPHQQPPISGYPNPVGPISTPAPVAPVFSTTEFTLPEIVENRNAKHHFNFIPLHNQYLPPDERPNYEIPKPPQHGDTGSNNGYYYQRPSTTSTTTTTQRPSPIVVVDPPEILPPISNEPVAQPPNQGPQGYDYNAPPPVLVVPPRPSTPAPAYLPPASNANEDQIVVESDAGAPLRLRIKEMRCLQQHGGFFRAALKVESFIGAAPSVDDDSNNKRCELKLSRSYVIVDIAEEDFHACGVRSCGKDLCLRLRFPAIRGMRTGSDAILTLHCKTQDRIAVKTHALKVGVTSDIQARSIGSYAHGGSQNPFRTHVELLRKSKNGFTKHLESNGAVQLGEDLLLRAHVLVGDGWNYTKLTDVSLQRISPVGEILNTANLITAHGCIHPSMQSICPQPPTFDPPLGHKLSFKAVMFQGMRSGDELILSMRITGCMEQHDCHVATQECNAGNIGRRKRNTPLESVEDKESVNGTEVSEISRISFRVVMQGDEPVQQGAEESKEIEYMNITAAPHTLIIAGTLGFVLLLTCLGIFIVLKLKK